MSQGFQNADFERLSELYNRFAPARYRIDAELLKLKTVDIPVFDWGASCVEDESAFVAVKRSAASLYTGPNRDVATLTLLAFTDPTNMVDLMNEVKRLLRNRGCTSLQFGTD